jgi:putative FmdB family regulatory protein
MPIYEYQCDDCGKTFDILQKFSDETLTTHPGCGGHVKRLVSAPALQFKGSGWYVTDYAKTNGSSKDSQSDGGKAEAGAKADAAKTDAAKSEAPKTESVKKSDTPAPAPAPPSKPSA